MLGTRADPVIDLVYLVTLAAPLVAYLSLRLVRAGRQQAHRRLQTLLLTTCVLAVSALEIRIRLASGSGGLMQGSPYAGSRLFWAVTIVHILGAVATYVVWCWLVLASRRRHGTILPGPFSHRHKTAGLFVIGGLCFTTLSATAVYFLAFVA
jgi:putative membrane protein